MPPKRPREEAPESSDIGYEDPDLAFIVGGCGAGASATYGGDASSTFLLRGRDGIPLLVVDLGFGAQRALSGLQRRYNDGRFPAQAPIYISHNHSDHAAELPVIAAVERSRRRDPLVVLAEDGVAETLKAHRLDELRSNGLGLDYFVDLQGLKADEDGQGGGGRVHRLPLPAMAGTAVHPVSWELGLSLVRAAHSERCFGFVLMGRRRPKGLSRSRLWLAATCQHGERKSVPWSPLLAFSGDSAADAEVYRKLARAPIVFLDARPGPGTTEHAGIRQVVEMAAEGGPLAGAREIFIYGYGGEDGRRRAGAELNAALAVADGGGGASSSSSSSSSSRRDQAGDSPKIAIAYPGQLLKVLVPRQGGCA